MKQTDAKFIIITLAVLILFCGIDAGTAGGFSLFGMPKSGPLISLCLVLAVSFIRGGEVGAVFGFAGGLLTQGGIGYRALWMPLLWVVLALLAGTYRRLVAQKFICFVPLCLVGTLTHQLVTLAALCVGNGFCGFYALYAYTLPRAALTLILCPAVYFLVILLNKLNHVRAGV